MENTLKDTESWAFGEKNTCKPHRYVNKPRKPATKLKANLMLREKTELAPPQISLLNDTVEGKYYQGTVS